MFQEILALPTGIIKKMFRPSKKQKEIIFSPAAGPSNKALGYTMVHIINKQRWISRKQNQLY